MLGALTLPASAKPPVVRLSDPKRVMSVPKKVVVFALTEICWLLIAISSSPPVKLYPRTEKPLAAFRLALKLLAKSATVLPLLEA